MDLTPYAPNIKERFRSWESKLRPQKIQKILLAAAAVSAIALIGLFTGGWVAAPFIAEGLASVVAVAGAVVVGKGAAAVLMSKSRDSAARRGNQKPTCPEIADKMPDGTMYDGKTYTVPLSFENKPLSKGQEIPETVRRRKLSDEFEWVTNVGPSVCSDAQFLIRHDLAKPKATAQCSEAELIAMGMAGAYRKRPAGPE
jgi:hypothetical protein